MKNRKHRKNKKPRDYSKKASKIQRFVAGLGMFLFAIISFAIAFINDYIQVYLLLKLKPTTLLLITNSVFTATVPFALITLITLMVFMDSLLYEKFILKNNIKWIYVSIILYILCLTIPFAFIFSRYEISENGIYRYSSFNNLKKHYSWKDIAEAKVYVNYQSYSKAGGDYFFNYDVKLKDGKLLDLYSVGESSDFWNSLYKIDGILKYNNVLIIRDKNNFKKLDKVNQQKVKSLIH